MNDCAYGLLILSHHEHQSRGQCLVDDHHNKGALRFKVKWLHFGSARFPNWASMWLSLGKKMTVLVLTIFIR